MSRSDEPPGRSSQTDAFRAEVRCGARNPLRTGDFNLISCEHDSYSGPGDLENEAT